MQLIVLLVLDLLSKLIELDSVEHPTLMLQIFKV
jgi:hypothetical protein